MKNFLGKVTALGTALMLFSPSASLANAVKDKETFNSYLPGVLLDEVGRINATNSHETASPFPSSKFKELLLSKEDTMRGYLDGNYRDVYESVYAIARTGDPWGMETLGIMMAMGQGTPKNEEKAFTWLIRAAKQGRPLAQHHAGTMYFRGVGVPRDYLESLKFLYLASQGYSSEAQKQQATSDYQKVAERATKFEKRRAIEMANEFSARIEETRRFEREAAERRRKAEEEAEAAKTPAE